MSAGSTFASQQKALRRQFNYSEDYPLATMIKELNTQILSRVGTGTLSEQLDELCRTSGMPTQPRRRRRVRRAERVCEPNRRVCRGSLRLSVGEGLISYAKTANRRP